MMNYIEQRYFPPNTDLLAGTPEHGLQENYVLTSGFSISLHFSHLASRELLIFFIWRGGLVSPSRNRLDFGQIIAEALRSIILKGVVYSIISFPSFKTGANKESIICNWLSHPALLREWPFSRGAP